MLHLNFTQKYRTSIKLHLVQVTANLKIHPKILQSYFGTRQAFKYNCVIFKIIILLHCYTMHFVVSLHYIRVMAPA